VPMPDVPGVAAGECGEESDVDLEGEIAYRV
jgi:hypothetical protein